MLCIAYFCIPRVAMSKKKCYNIREQCANREKYETERNINLSELQIKEYKRFENIKHLRADGSEFWLARELAPALEHAKWENFSKTIDRALMACQNSGFNVSDHFPEVRKMVGIGSKIKRQVNDYELSRYACYLIVQNGDPRKEVIAQVQTYIANQIHRHEVRSAIKRVGGTMPEDLPTPDKSIAQIEKERLKELKRRAKIKPLMLDE